MAEQPKLISILSRMRCERYLLLAPANGFFFISKKLPLALGFTR